MPGLRRGALSPRGGQHCVYVAYAGGLHPVPEFRGVKALDADGREDFELGPAQRRDDVPSDLQAVVVVGARREVALGRVLKPPRHVLADAHVLVVEDPPVRTVPKSLSQLVSDILPLFAIYRLALRSSGRIYPVAGHV
jgi:hypothetical protein